MIFLKTDDEIELLRQSNLLVGKTLAEVAKLIKPGVTTKELDRVAEEFIRLRVFQILLDLLSPDQFALLLMNKWFMEYLEIQS